MSAFWGSSEFKTVIVGAERVVDVYLCDGIHHRVVRMREYLDEKGEVVYAEEVGIKSTSTCDGSCREQNT